MTQPPKFGSEDELLTFIRQGQGISNKVMSRATGKAEAELTGFAIAEMLARYIDIGSVVSIYDLALNVGEQSQDSVYQFRTDDARCFLMGVLGHEGRVVLSETTDG